MYPVLPSQQYTAGMSLPNGVVLLDLSIAADDNEEVTAFFLAHEWGHQVLGHPYISLTPYGRFLMAIGGTAAEDAADRYGAKFLKAKDYEIDPVLQFLCSIPAGPPGDTHSSGQVRARRVAAAYGISSTNPCESTPSKRDSDEGSSATRTTEERKASGRWEIVACTHPLHPAGDRYPCTHVCMWWNGPGPCHPFDLAPCAHPAHPQGDRIWVPD